MHTVDEAFIRNDFVLASFGIEERKTGEILSQKICDYLEAIGFSIDNLSCVVRDDAKNMIASCLLMDVDRLILLKILGKSKCIKYALKLLNIP